MIGYLIDNVFVFNELLVFCQLKVKLSCAFEYGDWGGGWIGSQQLPSAVRNTARDSRNNWLSLNPRHQPWALEQVTPPLLTLVFSARKHGMVHRCRLICKKHLTYFPAHSQLCWREALPTAIVYICLSKPLFQFPGYQPVWRTCWKQQDHTPKPLVGWEAVHPNEHPISSPQPPIAGLWLQPHFVTWVWASLNVASWWQKSCQFTL